MDDTRRFASSSNAFGIDLYGRLRARPGNLVVSPASVTTGLAMTWAGAGGTTAERMRDVLHFEGPPSSVMQASARLTAALRDPGQPIVFRIANRLFGEKSATFEQAFLEATKAAYGAALEPVDFRGAPEASRARINDWVLEETEKRIRDLVPPGGVLADTRLVLANAIYFLGDWQDPFRQEATWPAPFFLSKAKTKDVPTMRRLGLLRLAQRNGLKALELPYQGGVLSMLLVLPDRVDGLPAVEESLTVKTLAAIEKSLTSTRVAVALPKFEVNPPDSLALGEVLAAMGMAEAFDRQRADFTGIANPPDPRERLCIGEVFHKAFVKADEKGTEAAAATAVEMMEVGAALNPVRMAEFNADHPFLFFIRHNPSGLVLFLGRVSDPSAS